MIVCADPYGTGRDTMTSHLIERVKQKFQACAGICILNRDISKDDQEKAWKQRAEDANLQITAEMLGARISSKRAKVGVNSRPQALAQSAMPMAGRPPPGAPAAATAGAAVLRTEATAVAQTAAEAEL